MAGKWGQARLEVAALRNEIEARLREGWTVRQLYLSLRKAGRLTVSLSTFSARVTHLADRLSPLRRDLTQADTVVTDGFSGVPGGIAAKVVEPSPTQRDSATSFRRFEYDPMERITLTPAP